MEEELKQEIEMLEKKYWDSYDTYNEQWSREFNYMWKFEIQIHDSDLAGKNSRRYADDVMSYRRGTLEELKSNIDKMKEKLEELIDPDAYKKKQEQKRQAEEEQIRQERIAEEEREKKEEKRKKEEMIRKLEEELHDLEKKQHKLKEKQHRLQQSKNWIEQDLCSNCGGKLSLWGRKCKICGHKNVAKEIAIEELVKGLDNITRMLDQISDAIRVIDIKKSQIEAPSVSKSPYYADAKLISETTKFMASLYDSLQRSVISDSFTKTAWVAERERLLREEGQREQ